MTATWIDEQRNELKKIYDKCKNMGNQEIILEAFSVYLLRILNGLSQMESSKLYGFEAQILGESMKLFCIHYISQVDCALEQGIDIEDKKKIISDIEESISKISNVYKNVIDSTKATVTKSSKFSASTLQTIYSPAASSLLTNPSCSRSGIF